MRKVSFLTSFLFLYILSYAQYPTDMTAFTKGQPVGINFYNGSSTIAMEIPPWTIGGEWHTYFMHDGNKTVTYSVPQAMEPNTSIDCTGKGGYFATAPIVSDPWKRSYSGIYSAHALTHPTQGSINIGFCHDENKNECGHEENTIDPAVKINCADSYQGYFAMVSAVWTPNTASDNWGQDGYKNDLGPILWPAWGFVAADGVTPTSQGLLQPSSIVSGGYIYIFVFDKGPLPAAGKQEEGRDRGIKLVRAPVSGCLDPAEYEVYYKDTAGDEQWLPSLPTGFTKENMLQYVRVKGPKSTDILPDEIADNTVALRFTAAKVNNTNYFIGCEEYLDSEDQTYTNGVGHARHHVALRFSNDLVHWSHREMIVETSEDWDASYFNYPIFLSADKWTNTAVDLDDFYIVGTHSQPPFINLINTLHVTRTTPMAMNFAASAAAPPPVKALLDPTSGMFYGVAPNPTMGSVQLKYGLSATANVQVTMHDITGRMLRSEGPVQRSQGSYVEDFDLSTLARGVYILELSADDEKRVYKVVRN